MTTSIMAAASSPPAFLVMTTFDAMVVGMQPTTTMPTKILGSILPEEIPPAAIIMRTRTGDVSAIGPELRQGEAKPTELYDWYENQVNPLDDNVQPPIRCVFSQLLRTQLGAIDQEDEPDGAVQDRILGSYDAATGCHICGRNFSPCILLYSRVIGGLTYGGRSSPARQRDRSRPPASYLRRSPGIALRC